MTARDFIAARVREEDRGFSTPCWVWQKALTDRGYARAHVPGFGYVRVHRASYELHVAPIPEGLVIDHLCRVRSCCNPAHLEAVTVEENSCRQHGREHGKCVRGHTLAETQNASGNCRLCRAALTPAKAPRENTKRSNVGLHMRTLPEAITHCPSGHEYTPENSYYYGSRRSCRACHRNRQRAADRARRA